MRLRSSIGDDFWEAIQLYVRRSCACQQPTSVCLYKRLHALALAVEQWAVHQVLYKNVLLCAGPVSSLLLRAASTLPPRETDACTGGSAQILRQPGCTRSRNAGCLLCTTVTQFVSSTFVQTAMHRLTQAAAGGACA